MGEAKGRECPTFLFLLSALWRGLEAQAAQVDKQQELATFYYNIVYCHLPKQKQSIIINS
jgi:hypothetical protein